MRSAGDSSPSNATAEPSSSVKASTTMTSASAMTSATTATRTCRQRKTRTEQYSNEEAAGLEYPRHNGLLTLSGHQIITAA
jgi:hypothetical protein